MTAPVLFDLDGTLIDSAPGILTSYSAAFASLGLTPSRPLGSDLIGPPLLPTMRSLAGPEADEATLQALVAAFKTSYDTEGYRASPVYPAMPPLLQALRAQGRALYIATNKRLLPTQRILAWLQWTEWFTGVYALDSLDPPAPSKGELLRHLIRVHGIEPARSWYVGDRDEDEAAARHAGLPCLRVPWGYGQTASAQGIDDFSKRLLETP